MARRVEDLEEFEKPREKLRDRGPEALTRRELIAVLIGSGTPDRHVLDLANEIERLLEPHREPLDLDALLDMDGIGLAKATTLMAALELGRRRFDSTGGVIEDPEDVLPYINFIRDKQQEYFVCLSLNGAHEVIETRVVTKGLVNRTQVHPREVFAPVLQDRAAAVILAHNHPSGSLEVSDRDRQLTEKLRDAGDLLGIDVLDHVIVTDQSHTTISET